MNQFLINFTRFSFLALISFEFLNLRGFLPFTLDFSWLGLIGTAFFIWLSLEVYHYFYQPLPWFIYFTAFSGVTLDAFSDIFHLYSQIIWWDRWMHFFEGAIAAIIILYLFKKSPFYSHAKDFSVGVYTILLISFLGFLYEYLEFLIDKFYFGYPKSLGDGPDTVDDMLFNLLGATIIMALLFFWNRKIKTQLNK